MWNSPDVSYDFSTRPRQHAVIEHVPNKLSFSKLAVPCDATLCGSADPAPRTRTGYEVSACSRNFEQRACPVRYDALWSLLDRSRNLMCSLVCWRGRWASLKSVGDNEKGAQPTSTATTSAQAQAGSGSTHRSECGMVLPGA